MANTSPKWITSLGEGEVFVFGSNLNGFHGGGAAALAMKWGAVWGQGTGLQGQTYAIPTMFGAEEEMKPYIDEFLAFAKARPEMKFLVTEIGCGIAGFMPQDIAPLFKAAIDENIENVYLPESFVSAYGAAAYCDRGNAHYDNGDYDRAIEDFDSAIRLAPDYAAAYFFRGLAHLKKDDCDRAIEDYGSAIRLDPNDAAAYFNRAFVYFAKKYDYDAAIEDYGSAIRLDPDYVKAYYNRGAAYEFKDDYDKAIEDYTGVIRLEPDNSAAYGRRGFAYCQKGDYDKAIEDCSEAIRLYPAGAEAYGSRGEAYRKKGDLDKAAADFETALRLDPDHAAAKKNLEKIRSIR